MKDTSRRRLVLIVLMALGTALLITSLFVGWYAYTTDQTSTSQSLPGALSHCSGPQTSEAVWTDTYYLRDTYSYVDTVTAPACAGPSSTETLSQSGTYAQFNRTHSGSLYRSLEELVIGAGTVGALATLLISGAGGRSRIPPIALVLCTLAMVPAAAAPLMLAGSSVAAVAADSPSPPYNSSQEGPWTSFSGSCYDTACPGYHSGYDTNMTQTWGPSIGWYLAMVGFGVLCVSAVLTGLWTRKLAGARSPPRPAPRPPNAVSEVPPGGPPVDPPEVRVTGLRPGVVAPTDASGTDPRASARGSGPTGSPPAWSVPPGVTFPPIRRSGGPDAPAPVDRDRRDGPLASDLAARVVLP